ncbi:peptidylprolyl isomerase [Streptomyces sp. NBC_01142]|uniref:peptidylprolyl isomerase n=1 Tax=Streptomyces sp. NBC_01142 TaxID=2975865 RepID=UPI0022520FC7|nr:peptidylprolyl isomerase [Streptomyces sp. NBC_01142]MCX4821546.1 peptidylprolyl isomerase [Streptomyces sp. NBC_01142]
MLGTSVLAVASILLTGEDSQAETGMTCSYLPGDRSKGGEIPSFDAKKAARPYTVKLVTNMGTVTFDALTGSAPCATYSFAYLARKGYFDNSSCNRVTTHGIFVLECGDPVGTEKDDPGYYYKDQNIAGTTYPAGSIAVSKIQPGRNGSRFFLSYNDPQVPMHSSWTRFGRVNSGLDVLQAIGRTGTQNGTSDGMPKKPVVIESVHVQEE